MRRIHRVEVVNSHTQCSHHRLQSVFRAEPVCRCHAGRPPFARALAASGASHGGGVRGRLGGPGDPPGPRRRRRARPLLRRQGRAAARRPCGPRSPPVLDRRLGAGGGRPAGGAWRMLGVLRHRTARSGAGPRRWPTRRTSECRPYDHMTHMAVWLPELGNRIPRLWRGTHRQGKSRPGAGAACGQQADGGSVRPPPTPPPPTGSRPAGGFAAASDVRRAEGRLPRTRSGGRGAPV